VTATFLLYLPGLRGIFLFDDAANLPVIGATGPIDNLAALARYLTSGTADPTGRPLSLLSFLIDARDWPADPWQFKLHNVVLHIVNGILLLAVLARLGRAYGWEPLPSLAAAAIGALLWTLHPLFVSTVLYAVQREAMLPATFALLALIAWMAERERALAGKAESRWRLAAWLGICTVMATLAKANGLLVPLLVLTVQNTLPSPVHARDASFRRWTRIVCLPVALLVVAGLIWAAAVSIGQGVLHARGWSLGQRLLTEPTILVDYLLQLWLLKPVESNLFHDAYRAASSWIDPWPTLPALIFCLLAVGAAWIARRRRPALALAILFFFGGHLMESTSLALELYFEHRNYLPSMFMFWPLGMFIASLNRKALSVAAAIAALLLVAGLAWLNTTVWGDPLKQAAYWAADQPLSPRAQAYVAQVELAYGDASDGMRRIDAASARFPGEPQVAFTAITIHCALGHSVKEEVDYVAETLRTTPRDPGALMVNWFEDGKRYASERRCEGLDVPALHKILDAADANPVIASIGGRRQDIDHLRGVLALAVGDGPAALEAFDRALKAAPAPQVALRQAAELGSAGFADLGLRHLGLYESLPPPVPPTLLSGMPWLHNRVLDWQSYWPTELSHLRAALINSTKAHNAQPAS
jgi:hypothetical protein